MLFRGEQTVLMKVNYSNACAPRFRSAAQWSVVMKLRTSFRRGQRTVRARSEDLCNRNRFAYERVRGGERSRTQRADALRRRSTSSDWPGPAENAERRQYSLRRHLSPSFVLAALSFTFAPRYHWSGAILSDEWLECVISIPLIAVRRDCLGGAPDGANRSRAHGRFCRSRCLSPECNWLRC